MKKELKTAVLAIALVTAGIGAFATKVAHTPKQTDPTYNWTRVAGEPILGEQFPFNEKTVEEAENNYGCSGSNADCASGVNPLNPLDTQVIKFN